MTLQSQCDAAFYYWVGTGEYTEMEQQEGPAIWSDFGWSSVKDAQAGDGSSVRGRASVHHLGPEVLLPEGIVLHARLQQPLGLHPLHTPHVPPALKGCPCGEEAGGTWGKGRYL